uniref:Uncharacterized protein n=1 Tax=Anguilla anguilla TaxID=7936 RepID=A0A0E9TF65_ANGAN
MFTFGVNIKRQRVCIEVYGRV